MYEATKHRLVVLQNTTTGFLVAKSISRISFSSTVSHSVNVCNIFKQLIILLHLELTIADDCDLWLLRAQFCLVILGPVRLFAQVELSHRQFLKKKKSHFASSKSLGRNALGVVSLNCKLSHFLLVVKVF